MTLLTITKVASVSGELMPFVRFRATLEERGLENDDDVAIFNSALSDAGLGIIRTGGVAAFVPEPGPLVLMVLGGLGLAPLLRPRRRKNRRAGLGVAEGGWCQE